MNRRTPLYVSCRQLFVLAFLIIALLVAHGAAEAATVTLQWDRNPETDVSGYVVAYGTASGEYTSTMDVGNQLQLQFSEPNPVDVYYFVVSAYNTAGLHSPYSVEVNTSSLTVPLSLTTLSADRLSPQSPGAAINFTASATGGRGPYQYKWRVFDGASWSVAQDWTAAYTFTWTPTSPNANARVGVWVRSATSTADAPDTSSAAGEMSYVIAQALSLTGISSNLPSPQALGKTINFTAAAAGGTAPYQYQWLLSTGSGWTVVQPWTTSSVFSWTPTALNANYRVGVWIRNAGSTNDGADNVNAGGSVPFAIETTVTPITVTGLASSVPSPQVLGGSVTFTAAVTGGTAPYQYKWLVSTAAGSTVAQAWSASNTFTWTPSVASAAYNVSFWVRSAGSTVDASETTVGNTMPYAVTAPTSLTSLTSNVSSPQLLGTSVTFTAAAAGGTAPYQYKWLVTTSAGSTVAQAWAASNSFVWTPTAANAAYTVGVMVRSATSTADAPDNAASAGTTPFAIQAPVAPLTMVSLSPNVASPQSLGKSITFTATAAGGTAPYQFQFFVNDGTGYVMAKAWSTSSAFVWTPTTASANYRVAVWIRNAGNTNDAPENVNAGGNTPFVINAAVLPVAVTSLTASNASPQLVGTSVTFTAAVTGGTAPYQYKWLVSTVAGSTVAQAWSASNTFTWTPSVANAGYTVSFWVRSAGSVVNASETSVGNAMAYEITTSPVTITSLTASKPAPQKLGTRIVFTVTAAGASAYLYQWTVSDGVTSTVVQLSSSKTFAWTPTAVNSNYTVTVQAQNAGNPALAATASMAFPITKNGK